MLTGTIFRKHWCLWGVRIKVSDTLKTDSWYLWKFPFIISLDDHPRQFLWESSIGRGGGQIFTIHASGLWWHRPELKPATFRFKVKYAISLDDNTYNINNSTRNTSLSEPCEARGRVHRGSKLWWRLVFSPFHFVFSLAFPSSSCLTSLKLCCAVARQPHGHIQLYIYIWI